MLKRVLVVLTLVVIATPAFAQSQPIEYKLSFPSPEHRWMQVEVKFSGVPAGPLQVRMARSSPGRYALAEFAKNVFDVSIVNGKGQPLTATRPDNHEWDVANHDGTVVVTYKIFGDRTDGTYLGIDDMHAHINIPASLMFARGWFDRPARVTFVQPPGKKWRVATQLFPTSDPLVFTAPNLDYLMDSPTDFSNFMLREFTIDDGQKRNGPPPTFRVALTHDGTEAEADAFAKDVERIVREELALWGEFPNYETNTYTFLSVYLPWANGDGMEHRNSTSLTNSGALRNPQQRSNIIGTVAHEFFHNWNMERLRSKGIEPFDFERADMSDDLWLGEGFTNYFDGLVQTRAGFTNLDGYCAELAGVINQVTLSPGRMFRSAVDMSRLAPFTDAAVSVDRTAWPNLFISYYTYGQAIGLGLDLTLRDRTNGKTTADDYMRALWAKFGKPGQKEPGRVATPYTIDGLKETLASLSGDRAFTNDFFAKYVEGKQVVDYGKLLERAGLILRKRSPGRPFVGQVQMQQGGSGLRVTGLVPWESQLYKSGVSQDDQITAIDGTAVTSTANYDEALARHKPGEKIALRFVRRDGEVVNTTITLDEDPRVEVVPAEKIGQILTADQKAFRDAWLNSRQKR